MLAEAMKYGGIPKQEQEQQFPIIPGIFLKGQ
jgi:hypothetical protein